MIKRYVIIAGVNGAGKSTLYFSNDSWSDLKKINLDEIVKNIGSWKNPKDVLAAGKIVIQMINECLENGISFCQETTLCGKMILKNIRKAKELGYFIEVHYVGLNSAELAKKRVQYRVSNGGHGIAEEDIERRYVESFQNMQEIMDICDLVLFYDNTYSFKRFAIARNGDLKRIHPIETVPAWYVREGFDTTVVDYIVEMIIQNYAWENIINCLRCMIGRLVKSCMEIVK